RHRTAWRWHGVAIAELETKSFDELQGLAKDLSIPNFRRYRKQELIMKILQVQTEQSGLMFRSGILEIMQEGYGFLRTSGYLPGPEDIYVSPSQIKRFGLRVGDEVLGQVRAPKDNEKYYALLRVEAVNGLDPEQARSRPDFEKLTPVFPHERFKLELPQSDLTVRIVDLFSLIGKGEGARGVVVLLDSLTRFSRANDLVIPPSGRTLSGGLDPAALHRPKRFFGAARKIEEGGSITIVATALIDTGSRMDDVIYEEFKGTGNMELHLNRKLQERRTFPAIDIKLSGTRREELLLNEEELRKVWVLRKSLETLDTVAMTELILDRLRKTPNNQAFLRSIIKNSENDA